MSLLLVVCEIDCELLQSFEFPAWLLYLYECLSREIVYLELCLIMKTAFNHFITIARQVDSFSSPLSFIDASKLNECTSIADWEVIVPNVVNWVQTWWKLELRSLLVLLGVVLLMDLLLHSLLLLLKILFCSLVVLDYLSFFVLIIYLILISPINPDGPRYLNVQDFTK